MVKKITDSAGNTQYQYVQCPVCKSKKRHFEFASERAIKMGVAEPGSLIPFIYENKTLVDPQKFVSALVGSEAPTIIAAAEICMDCGCVYAPMVIHGKAKKEVKPKIVVPRQG